MVMVLGTFSIMDYVYCAVHSYLNCASVEKGLLSVYLEEKDRRRKKFQRNKKQRNEQYEVRDCKRKRHQTDDAYDEDSTDEYLTLSNWGKYLRWK